MPRLLWVVVVIQRAMVHIVLMPVLERVPGQGHLVPTQTSNGGGARRPSESGRPDNPRKALTPEASGAEGNPATGSYPWKQDTDIRNRY